MGVILGVHYIAFLAGRHPKIGPFCGNPRGFGNLGLKKKKRKNHSTQDSRVVPHRGTNWAALWLTAQIGRDAVLSESYGRGCE